MRLAQATLMVDQEILLITAEDRIVMVPMNKRICLGYRPRMNSMTLYPKDPNVKHEDVEQRGLGSMTQTKREGKLIKFLARARKNEVSKRSASRILKHLTDTSSTNDLHNGVSKEESPSTTSEAVVGKDYEGRNPVGIVIVAGKLWAYMTFN